ncbi:MAG: flagellar export protein FliJ [Bdellovibrionales bacterium RIFOXYB1_FULL_37_110]|nr:MAG: flagellar export protein FliJ [Bdellovibrionales bacterium RIFOXYA1_FULL_38_20]OFZ48389.1 MAG: flagellar export protein FliJ [Bdellovibrionales bacterium RIFOXYC1_FULL_37_79]OFZ61058.1 MAG: flagellar export protein FliJ [Bdellovibrionales bacterium RIFOXYB1_FULL_37_110]OFZ65183.1 MAG: flagellar export protein FliJ [Bdellovibrionales bacterium RIFOXYD1_FULL_36_51]
MKKFDFRLQSLLRLRNFKEEKLKAEMGEIVSKMNNTRDDIINLNQDIEDAYTAQNKFLNEKIGGQIIQFFGFYVQGKREHIKVKQNELEVLKKKYEEKSHELAKAMGDVKVIESIKKKQFNQYRVDYNKKAQEEIEDLLRMKNENG